MQQIALLGDLLTWSNPLTYFFIAMLFVILKSVQGIIRVSRVLKEEGISFSDNMINNSGSIFKWTAMHQVQTGILMVFIVMLGIMMAVNF